jgi:hypothetical protein
MPTRHQSRKFISHTTEGDKGVAKYFVPALAIRDFMPVEPAHKAYVSTKRYLNIELLKDHRMRDAITA